MSDLLAFLDQFKLPISHGLFYGIAAIGLSLPVKYLQVPDFTTLGSMMLGGIVGLVVFTASGLNSIVASVIGLAAGGIAGALLGLLTSFLNLKVRISLVYAGILTYVASQSAAYLLAPTGHVDIGRNERTIFSFLPGAYELIVGLAFALVFAALLHREFKMKRGKLVMAMTASEEFRRLRHPGPARTKVMILLGCNVLVGLSGSLFAVRDREASVLGGNELSFLMIGLGSIYVFEFVAQILQRVADATIDAAENPVSLLGRPIVNFILRAVSERFSSKYDDSKRSFVTSLGYVSLCVLVQLLYSAVSNSDNLPAHLEYVVTVVVIISMLSLGIRFRTTET